VLQLGPHQSEHRRPEQNPAEQHPHHRGLADAAHGLADEAADQHQRDELHEQDDVGCADALGRERGPGAQDQRYDDPGYRARNVGLWNSGRGRTAHRIENHAGQSARCPSFHPRSKSMG
jgi:hypothetical protein